MFDKVLGWLHTLNMRRCPKCGSRDDHWEVVDIINGIVCEAKIICDDCGAFVNYWAYGHCEYPETYTGLLAEKFYYFCHWLRSKGASK